MSAIEVPMIDLTRPEDQLITEVKRACKTSGFFYVGGHGIPSSLVEDTMEANRRLFKLPLEQKQALLANENNRGWTPLGEETLDPSTQKQGDTKEGFYFGREISPASPEADLPLHGPNQWPSESQVPGYQENMEQYMQAMNDLGHRLLHLLALGLNLPADHFDRYFDRPMIFLRPLHYAPQVSAPDEGVFGAGAHSDYGMLTLLKTDDVPGLQIHTDATGWMDVPPKQDCFIINLGDMLERWTNGLYKSTLHRVVNSTGEERYSIACFFEPNFDSLVECLPQCCGPDRPPRFPPTTSGQHLLDKYASTHAGYANLKQ